MGVIDIKTSDRNGPVIGAVQVGEDDEIMLITDAGTLVRTAVSGVSTVGRNTQGVRLIRLNEGESLVELTPIDESDVSSDDDDSSAEEAESSTDESAADSANTADSSNDDDSSDEAPDNSEDESN